jgi:hypothetical protein
MGTPTSAPSDEDTISQAYAALERLYSEGRWNDTEVAGQALLAMLDRLVVQLDHSGTTFPQASSYWRERVLLVLGHTHFYGLDDPAAAAAQYQQVLDDGSDPMLRDIASAGLAQCQAMRASKPSPALPDATPWLNGLQSIVQANNPEQTDSSGQTAETLFPGFVQAVQIAEPTKTEFPPQQIVGEQVQEQLQKHLEQQLGEPRQEPSSQPLSPEDQDELALGLLRVVIQAN